MAGNAWVPDRCDMIWIDCNPQAGREMRDFHPLLVLSPQAFNQKTGIVIGLPMTTAAYNETNPFAVKVTGPKGETVFILAHQPKSFDWRARGAKPHPWRRIEQPLFDLACETLNQIIVLGNV